MNPIHNCIYRVQRTGMIRRRNTGLLATIRRPEYTGKNRCVPCTVVNLIIAAGVAGATGFVSFPLGVAVAMVSVAAIYFRGYLVPGTPELTKRYLPEYILTLFGKADPPEPSTDVAFDTVTFLERNGVIEDVGDDVALTPEFKRQLGATALEIDITTGMTAAAADLLDVNPDRVSFVGEDGSWRVLVDESIRGRWESRAAFVADLAAYQELSTWTDEWALVPEAARGQTLSAIRACLDFCPTCGGTIQLGTELVSSCCREYEVVAATCTECNARLFEMNAHVVENAQ